MIAISGPFRKLRLINGNMAYGKFEPAITSEGRLVAFVNAADGSVVPVTSVIQAFKVSDEETSS